MSRIVVASHGSLGDLYPLIGIALKLRDRGHEIVMAIQLLKSFKP